MKYLYIFVFFVLFFNVKSQDDEVYCFDVKVGVLQTDTYSSDFSKRENTFGSRGNLNYPYVSLPYDIAPSQSTKLFAPYLNIGLGIRYNPYFELAVGFSYIQLKNDINYADVLTENLSTSSLNYSRYLTKASGKLTNNIYRIEFAPVYRIFNTKIIFGVLNMDISKSKTKFEGTKIKYDVIYKQNSWGYDQQYPEDSLVTEVSSEIIKPDYNLKDRIYFPLSIAIEQEILIKKLRYLIGVKAAYSKRSYAPFSIIVYVGIRLSKIYTWSE